MNSAPRSTFQGAGLTILSLIVILFLAGCSSTDGSPSTATTATTIAVAAPTTTTSPTSASSERSLTGTVTVSGSSVTVEARVTGFSVRFVPNDISGETGHLHLYIDRDPPPGGGIVPLGDPTIVHSAGTTLTTTLAPGRHVIWLVAADGDDRALIPPQPVRFEVDIGE